MGTWESQGELAACRAALRSMALELSRAEDAERTRIARDLHDDLGQTLAAVRLRLAELEEAATDEVRQACIAGIGDLVAAAVQSIRTLTFGLSAPAMPEVGIEVELEHLATHLTEKHGVPCRYDSDAEPKPVSPEVAVALLRVGRELLYNIKKHSRADKASLMVERARDRIRLTVRDDGIGFQPQEPSTPERVGLGLLIVRERLAEIDGDVEIDSDPDSGTRIVVTAPLLAD